MGLRNDNRSSMTTLGRNLTFFNGPFCGRFLETSLMIRSSAFLRVMGGAFGSVGMDWISAETGSATARVTGGMPPVLRSFAAAAFFFILRCLLPMTSHNELVGGCLSMSENGFGP